MSEVRQATGDEWTPDAMERLLALMFVKDPKWYAPLMWALHRIPRTQELRRDIDRYQIARAVRIYRSRK